MDYPQDSQTCLNFANGHSHPHLDDPQDSQPYLNFGNSHSLLTWVLPPTAPLDEADDEEDEHEEGDGAHEADEPALRGDVHLVLGVGCGKKKRGKYS